MRFPRQARWIRTLAVVSAAITAAVITVLISSCMTTEASDSAAKAYVPEDFRKFSSYDESEYRRAFHSRNEQDSIADHYIDPVTRESVLAFFTSITESRDIAEAILDNSVEFGVPASLSFALAYEESQFHPRAIHRNAESVDRGLFQLNSRTFPLLSIEDFYNPAVNAREGISHLGYCLSEGGNTVAALAIYNAGLGRVSKGGTPRKTLDYIARITNYAKNLESLFEAQVVARRVAVKGK
jgi:hypothetical protein